jgi:hypothetical protein
MPSLKKLSSKCEFRENQRSGGHTLPKRANEIMYFLLFRLVWIEFGIPQKLTR